MIREICVFIDSLFYKRTIIRRYYRCIETVAATEATAVEATAETTGSENVPVNDEETEMNMQKKILSNDDSVEVETVQRAITIDDDGVFIDGVKMEGPITTAAQKMRVAHIRNQLQLDHIAPPKKKMAVQIINDIPFGVWRVRVDAWVNTDLSPAKRGGYRCHISEKDKSVRIISTNRADGLVVTITNDIPEANVYDLDTAVGLAVVYAKICKELGVYDETVPFSIMCVLLNEVRDVMYF